MTQNRKYRDIFDGLPDPVNETKETPRAWLEKRGISPLEKVMQLVESAESKLTDKDKLKAWLALMPYCYATLKSVEVSSAEDRRMKVIMTVEPNEALDFLPPGLEENDEVVVEFAPKDAQADEGSSGAGFATTQGVGIGKDEKSDSEPEGST